MTNKEAYSNIKKMDNYCGLLGFSIAETVSEMDNLYEDIGGSLDYLIEKNPEQIDLIEAVVIAISGYGFETLKEKMEFNMEYYGSL